MKFDFKQILSLVFLAMVFTTANAQQFLWVKTGGGAINANNTDVIYGMDTDASGNTFSCGTYTGTFTLGNTNYSSTNANIWAGKQDANGNWLWTLPSPTLTGTQYMRAYSLKVDANGDALVCGVYASNGGTITMGSQTFGSAGTSTAGGNGFIMKLDGATGAIVWTYKIYNSNTAAISNSNVEPFRLHVDATGNVYASGRYSRTAYFGATNGPTLLVAPGATSFSNGFVTKVNSSGVHQWAGSIQGNGQTGVDNNKTCYGVTTDASGNVYACGYGLSGFFFNGAASAQSTSLYNDAFMAKWSPTGTATGVWLCGTGTLADRFAYDIAYLPNGTLAIAGRYNRHGNIYRMTTVGALSSTFAATSNQGSGIASEFLSIDYDANSDVYVTGSCINGTHTLGGVTTTATTANTLIAKINSTNTGVWAMNFGTTSTTLTNEYGRSIAVISPDEFVLGGLYATTTVIGTTPNTFVINANGNSDFYITRYGVCQAPAITQQPTNGAICSGGFASALGLTTTGIGFTYQWEALTTPPSTYTSIVGATSNTYTPTGTGTYRVVLTGCSTTVTSTAATVANSASPTIAITGNTTVCPGFSTTLTATGGSTYIWSNSTTTAANTVSPTAATTYTVTGTDAVGCTATASAAVTMNTAPTAAIAGNSTVCIGSAITLTASGGGTYLWSTGETTAAIAPTPTVATTYTVTVTGTNGCTASASKAITIAALPTAAITGGTTTVCFGSNVSLTASGGGTYLWSTGATTAAITAVANTTAYVVTVTSASGCTATASRTITTFAQLNVVISGNNTPCTATQTLTASGANTYTWNAGITGATYNISVPANGNTYAYNVTGTAANGCTASATFLVTNNTPSVSINTGTAVCPGVNVALTASGTGSSYLWSTGETTAAINVAPLVSTIYQVTATGASGCTASATRSVLVYTPTASISASNLVICAGTTVNLQASGGNTYAWSNGATGGATNVVPTTTTTYSVTSTSTTNGCTASASQTITVVAVSAAITGNTSICFGGTTVLTASGGTSYGWSHGFNTTSVTVGIGVYTVTVTNNGCTATASATVSAVQPPTVSVTGTNTICVGSSTTLTATGGGTYAWSNASTTAAITVSPTTTTTYVVTVTNASGCTATSNRTVTVNVLPTAVINGPTTVCAGSPATLTATAAPNYLWSNGATTASITVTPTATTTYSLTTTNAQGCTATTSQTLSVNSTPTATISGGTSVCTGSSITLTANGGNTYTWSNGATTSSITVSPTAATTYTVTASLGGSCTATASQAITIGSIPTAAITGNSTVCAGVSTTLTASGGATYAWSNGTTTAANSVTPTTGTSYTVTVTNAAGCTATAAQAITVNNLPTAAIAGTSTVCAGTPTTLTASGGTAYAWSNGTTTAANTVTPTTGTTYNVTVTNAAGCTATTSQAVTVNSLPTASVGGNSNFCAGTTTTLTATGGGTYAWSNGATTAAITVTPTSTTTYTVTVSNANNCTATTAQLVTVNALPVATISGPTAICAGLSATLTAGGNGAYVWNGGQTTSSITVTPTSTTTYTLTVTTTSGCTATATQSVAVNSQPTASISGNTSVCAGTAAVLTANGGATYTWSNGTTSANLSVTPTTNTTYTVTVSLGGSCTASASQLVTVNALPTASISGANSVCLGSSTNITATGGTSYVWNTSETSAAISVSPTSTTSYFVTVTDANGCTGTASQGITVNDITAITSSAQQVTLCSGSALNISVSAVGTNLTYAWDLNGTALSNTGTTYTDSNIATNEAGTYNVVVTGACGTATDVVTTVIVNSSAQTSLSETICAGSSTTFNGQTLTAAGTYTANLVAANGCDSIVTFTLTVNTPTTPVVTQTDSTLSTSLVGTSYQWFLGGTAIAGATNASYTASQSGAYTVQVVDANGCTSTSAVFNYLHVGLETVWAEGHVLYPNPTEGMIYLNNFQATAIEVFSTDGRLVMTANNVSSINLGGLTSGTYLVRCYNNEAVATVRVIKN